VELVNVNLVFDIALVLAVVASGRQLKSIRWIQKAPTEASRKTRLRILVAVLAAVLSVPFTLRTTLARGPYSAMALASEWFVRAFLAWLAGIGAFDWLKPELPTVTKTKKGDSQDDPEKGLG
jgi:hypothetical protein